MPEFCHLHTHTQYSLLDGAARIESLVTRAAELEIPALAITDHGNLFGVPEFYTAARRAGVQPIIGCEFYLCADMAAQERTRYHQVLLAKNEEGYRNLIRLSSLSYTQGFYYSPRIDHAALRAHSAGLIATTCCLQGEVLQAILKHGEEAARPVFETYLDIFGEDYYIEIQDHGIEDQRKCNEVLLRWAKEYGVKVIAANDVHYIEREDAAAQDVLLCLQTGRALNDSTRMRFEGQEFFLKSEAQMRAALAASIEDPRRLEAALATTREVAEKCKLELPMGELLMPHFPIPAEFGRDTAAYLRHLVYEGARRRYGEIGEHVRERLEHELAVIQDMGFEGYFLIVQDFTTAARKLGVSVGPGRGSAAGSAVAYCLGITNIDPLEYDLLFERFLNPERVSMPDIDIDFDDRGRAKVIDYVVKKYGRESVCQIVTFGTMGARSVLRDVARVLEIPLAEADRIARLVPEGVKVSLEQARAEVPEFDGLFESPDPQVRRLMHYATVLEGSTRHTGVHAAGVIIAPGDVSQYVPLAVQKGKGGDGDVLTTQYDGKWIERFGLLKMDFLGLKTLTVLNDALALIREGHGTEIDLEALPLDDPTTYQLFQRGDTVGIFQFESEGMREYMRKLRPTSIDDLIAMNALYRPGPMDLIPTYIDRKHGREEVTYPHPMLAEILEPTYGIPVYQEQVMQMAQVMGGYSLGHADLLRRAMGKKQPEEMAKQRVIFKQGAAERGVNEKTADEVFDMMERFAGYGFNKCVVGETEITEARTGARTTVGDLFRRRASLARSPFSIHALDEKGRLQPRRVTDVVWNGVKPVFELETALGKRITATGNHPFRTLDGWTHLADLRPGDRIAAPRRLEIDTSATWPEHELIVLAGLLAEGNTCHPSCLYFYGNDRRLAEDFAQNIERFGGTRARTYERPDGRIEVCASTGRDTRFGRGPSWNRRGVKVQAPARSGAFRWAEALGILGKKADEKFVPPAVFALRDADIALFLGRLWAGDGFIANGRQNVPFYATSSERLARDVQALLLRLGIVSRVASKSFRYRGGTRLGFTVHPLGEGAAEAFLEHVAPHALGREAQTEHLRAHVARTARGRSSKDTIPAEVRAWVDEERRAAGLTWKDLEAASGVSMKAFYGRGAAGKRGFRRATLARLARFFGSARLAAISESDVFWDEVVRITPRGLADTYDLTVEHDHNFVADGLIAHNSHSAAYSLVAYHTAYLKAHYPAEFMAAHLTNEAGDSKKLAIALEEARRMGLALRPPCVNRSLGPFSVEADGGGRAVRFGLAAIRGVGEGAVEAIVSEREAGGAFASLFDFCRRVDLRAVNRSALEALTKAGAFDFSGAHRAQLAHAAEDAYRWGQQQQHDRALGQNSLFGGGDDEAGGKDDFEPNLPHVESWTRAETLRHERDLMGFYVSGHPLDAYQAEVRAFVTAFLGRPDEIERGREHRACGIITEVRQITTRQGKPMAFVTLEDQTGIGEVVLFTSVFERVAHLLKPDEVVMVRGPVEERGGAVKIRANTLEPMWKVREQHVRRIVLRLDADATAPEALDEFFEICQRNRGGVQLLFDVAAEGLPQPVRLRARTCVVEPTPELMQGAYRLCGPDAVALEGEA